MSKVLKEFIDYVINRGNINKEEIKYIDTESDKGDRIFIILNDNTEYTIRTWDIRENTVRYSLYIRENETVKDIISSETYSY